MFVGGSSFFFLRALRAFRGESMIGVLKRRKAVPGAFIHHGGHREHEGVRKVGLLEETAVFSSGPREIPLGR